MNLTSTDSNASFGTVVYAGGVGSVSTTLKTEGTQTVTVADHTNTNINAASNPVTVVREWSRTLSWALPNSLTAGNSTTISFTAEDAYGNVDQHGGPVTFSSTDAKALFGSPSFNLGVGTASVTLETAGTQTVKVKDSTTLSISGTSNIVTVSAATASQLLVNPATSSITAGGSEVVSLTAEDTFGNVAADSDKVTLSDALGGTPNVTATLSSGGHGHADAHHQRPGHDHRQG